MKTVLIFLLALLSSCGYTFAQTVDRTGDKNYTGQATIGTDTTAYLATPSSAWLQVGRDSTTKGMLPPRVVDTSDVTSPSLGNTVFQIEDSTYYVYKGTWQKIGGSISLAAYMKKSDSSLYVSVTRQADSIASVRNDMVKASGSQTISGTKTFTSTAQFLSGSGSTARFIRTLASGGNANVPVFESDFEPTTPTAGIGTVWWMRAYDTTKDLVSVGTIGGRLMDIDTGEQAGEIHLSPAWKGSLPDTNRAGLSVLATGADSADTYVYGGSLFLVAPPESGSPSDSLLIRGADGTVRQISANALLQVLNEDTVTAISAMTSYTGAAHILVVTDTLQGGVFYKSSQTLTNDNGVVFSASGGGHWVRLYNHAHGVNVDWWGARNQTTVNKAIAYAGDGGIVNFTPKKIYTLTGSINPKEGQTLQGNGAVLFRAADSVVHLTQDAQVGDSFIIVNAVPAIWTTNQGLVQLFTDSTNYGCVSGGQYIEEIDGDTVWLGIPVPANAATNWNHPTRTYWPADTTQVHHVFDMVENAQGVNFKVIDLTFDGNRANNDANHSWTINASVTLRGDGAQSAIEDCRFEDIPNENIVGQGFKIINNTADSLSGSFVHLSADFSESPSPVPSFVNGNAVTNSNLIEDSVGGHSEGAITCSITPGYVNIENNRFKNGSNAFIGVIANSVGATNGAFRNVVVTGNYAENFHRIFYSLSPISTTFSKAGHIIVSGNIFNNCDTTDWTSSQSTIDTYFDTITVGENQLVGGTVWDIPVQQSDASQRYILNNASSTAQGASINVSGDMTISSIKSATILATNADGKIIAGTAPIFGSASFAGDGTTTTFNVTVDSLPSEVMITPTSASAAQALFFISARSATSFSVTVPTNGTIPPDTGTQNVTFNYELIY